MIAPIARKQCTDDPSDYMETVTESWGTIGATGDDRDRPDRLCSIRAIGSIEYSLRAILWKPPQAIRATEKIGLYPCMRCFVTRIPLLSLTLSKWLRVAIVSTPAYLWKKSKNMNVYTINFVRITKNKFIRFKLLEESRGKVSGYSRRSGKEVQVYPHFIRTMAEKSERVCPRDQVVMLFQKYRQSLRTSELALKTISTTRMWLSPICQLKKSATLKKARISQLTH